MMAAMGITVAACPCEAASGIRRISAFSSAFRATSLELISKVQTSVALSVKRRKDEKRRDAVLLPVGADLNWEKEEARWVREEQRWLREEQRWIREEARWIEEKQALVEESTALKNQVAVLKLQLEELRSQLRQDEVTDASLRNLVAGMKTLLQALSAPVAEDSLTTVETAKLEVKQIPRTFLTSESSAKVRTSVQVKPPVIVAPTGVIAVVTSNEVPLKSSSDPKSGTSGSSEPQVNSPIPRTAEESGKASTSPGKKSRTLKTGMDGDDVKELQEALAKQGFYSGEEEIEFSMFSDGTESAVKTWQATIGIPEDGQVTAQLLSKLLGGVEMRENEKGRGAAPKAKDVTASYRKSPVAAQDPATRTSREIDRYERTNAQDTNASQRRVYLLGENRWEEPGRLTATKVESKAAQVNGMKLVVEKCFSCRGEGTMLCTDCEGTGDLNVEEQFLEWVGEEPKCPYCDGIGAVPCDVCDGQGVQAIKS